MSKFMTTLANAIANHVKEGKISIYKNSDVVYSSSKFQECLSRCSGVKFYDFDKRGHWVGNQFLPSTTSTATTFAIPPTEDIA